MDGEDPRWQDWYGEGLAAELDKADAFIAVIDEAWDSSTWMGTEAQMALDRMQAGSIKRMYFFNPDGVTVAPEGMRRYLKEPLPEDLTGLVEGPGKAG